MANSKMLIDATHPEETRVVVQRNGRVEEFDFESAARKLLRGNIYLAKVTRVEPSLQAAFVDYGGNRHGFLAFNEIHPDYYQIPVADRQALIEEEAAAEAELEAAADRRAEALARRSGYSAPAAGDDHVPDSDERDAPEASADDEAAAASHIVDVEEDEHIEEVGGLNDPDAPQTVAATAVPRDDRIVEEAPTEPRAEFAPDTAELATPSHHEAEDDEAGDDGEDSEDSDDNVDHEASEQEHPRSDEENVQADSGGRRRGRERGDYHDDAPRRRRPRSYKIQEVIKRRQIILVQVVKEERGNKGAALTTYLSLAGRYTVLMPNTARGGGISRKITNPQDRKRLKAIAQELEVPEGMGLIIRTAGAARTKQEIKRDFEYLLRLWESVRDLTLQSTAPALVYEEGDLIKRSIRDLYNKDVDEIVVAGDAGYQEAAGFMRMLMPSHIKNVIEYKDPTPLFTRFGVERQLNAMFQPQVTLRSGGYIVINQTEALVAIDVNSGKSTREFSIEETALATNLEASEEIARQLKLRDLAGLIVIDFIDMEEKRNNRAVERRLKDALRFDRARIQLGRISHFGLMEMSRQRLRTGVLEGSTSQCPHCQGTGAIRSTESISLAVLRGLEDAITAGAQAPLVATCATNVALYILNSKRAYITDMETRHGYSVTIVGSERMHGANYSVERGAASALPARRPERAAVNMNWGFEGDEAVEEAPAAFDGASVEVVDDFGGSESDDRNDDRRDRDDDGQRRGRRRRRGRGRGRGERGDRPDFRGDRDRPQQYADNENGSASEGETGTETAAGEGTDDGEARGAHDHRQDDSRDDRPGRRRRRGRRGGRRGRERDRDGVTADADAGSNDEDQHSDPVLGPSAPLEVGGLGPQPEIGDIDQQPAPASARGNGNGDRSQRGGRSRPGRVWDNPAPKAKIGSAGEVKSEAKADPKPEAKGDDLDKAATVNNETVHTDAPAPRRRHETGSSEPRIERVVVSSNAGADDAGEASASPQRKGWWQRRFGGE